MASFLSLLSALFGWVYNFCWSASFYPQPLLNLRRRSMTGTTVDFPLLNVLGFAAYLASTVAFYSSGVIRAQSTASPSRCTRWCCRWSRRRSTSRGAPGASRPRPARGRRAFIVGVAAGCLAGLAVTWAVVGGAAAQDWCELDLVYAAGYVKLVVTLVKYSPQVVANWRNRSTDGWSIWQVLLDVAGGVLSMAQQAVDSYLQRDWSGITGNPVKFALGNASLCYDSIFMVQHYVVYRASPVAAKAGWRSEEEPLLEDAAGPAAEADDDRRRRRLD